MTIEVLELAFSRASPPTAGSIKGTTPRRARVVGRVGSEQMEGMLTTKGLKFCSAATSPRAAATAASLEPNYESVSCVSQKSRDRSHLSDDVICLGKLSTWVGSSKEELDRSAGKSCCLARCSEVSQGSNCGNGAIALLLSKSGVH